MSFFQNIGIKSRFNIITLSVFTITLIIISFFIVSVKKINRYNEYYHKTDKLKILNLNLRRYELQFFLRYDEDSEFFISEKNKYIDKFNKTAENFSKLNQELINHPVSKKYSLRNKLIKISDYQEQYTETFYDLTHKLFIRGNLTSGIIGDLKQTEQEILMLNIPPQTKSAVSEIILLTDNYILSGDEKNYSEFLKLCNKLLKAQPTIENDTVAENRKIPASEFDKILQLYKTNFTALVRINNLTGQRHDEGLLGKLRTLSQNTDSEIDSLYNSIFEVKQTAQKQAIIAVIIFFTLIGLIFIILFKRFSNSVVKPLEDIKNYIKPLSLGIFPSEKLKVEGKNEIASISEYTNNLIDGLERTSKFAQEIGKGNYNIDYKPLSEKDALGNALLEMKENIVKTAELEEKRKKEDEIRTWTNEGLTKFNDILRQTQGNIQEMSSKVISELVKFINANQGGMFVFSDGEEDKYLELTAAYAYGKEKKKQKIIYPGEGMVGMVALEKKTVYMTEIPESYITITSGLGEAVPRSLLIVPMITEEEIIGVIELASFYELKQHEINFVEILSKTIASSLAVTRINQRTAILLEQSQKQAELMKIQEEEMRQNFEELQQAQEDSAQKAAQMASILAAIDTSSLVSEIDLNGNITSVNRGLIELLGVDENTLTGIKLKDFIHTETEQEFNEFWQRLINGQNVQRNEHITINDKEFWFAAVYAPIIDDSGKILYILSIASDLSESKKLETELKEREKQLRKTLEEVEKAHKEAERKQHILENTNEMLKANEKTLQSAVESAMKQRKELAKKIDEIAEKEAETNSWLEGINQTNIVAEFDLERNILNVNHIFEKTFGYKKTEIEKLKHDILVSENIIKTEEYAKRWEKLKRGIHISGTFSFKAKNNQTVYIQGTYTAIKDHKGKTIKIYLVGFDTSDLIKKSEELKARETELFFQVEEMKHLQEQSLKLEEELTKQAIELAESEAVEKSKAEGINRTNIVAEFNTEGKIIFTNQKFDEIFGYTEKELAGKHHNILITDDFANSNQYKQAWESLTEGNYVSETFAFLNKKGEVLFIQGTYTPIKNSDGKVIKILLVGFDNTELMKKAEKLKLLEEKLKNK